MKNKTLILTLILLTICFFTGVKMMDGFYSEKVDIIEVNEILNTVEKNIGNESILSQKDFSYDLTVIYKNGRIPFNTSKITKQSYQKTINESIRNHETILFYSEGAIIIYTNEYMKKQRKNIMQLLLAIYIIFVCTILLQNGYIRYRIIKPFQRLQEFAKEIATGDFEQPLPMDKNNIFGAFTESFDLMREELRIAKQKAIILEKKKNELVATLSHDIKTPLASIIAVSEMMLLTEEEQKKVEKLKGIHVKADEINQLISNLFQSTLEELVEINVELDIYESEIILEMLTHADMLNKITMLPAIPSCLIKMDPLRLGQVFSNILSNAYKYANTRIDISFELLEIKEKVLQIKIKDYGTTLDEKEIIKLGSKFFRGNNTKGVEGAGLGLYNCKNLIEKMGGKLEFSQEETGFLVSVSIKLA